MSGRYEVRISYGRFWVVRAAQGREVFFCDCDRHEESAQCIAAALNAQEERLPPTMTPEEAREFQRWKGMNGAIAYQLIERHADGWADVGVMMDAWLEANALNQQAGVVEDEAAVERLAAHLYRRIYGNFAFAHASARKKSEMRDEARAAIAAVKEKGRG